jgi:hypothetical protein
MRGFKAVDLSNYNASNDFTVDSVKYTVQSDSEWVRDSTGGAESCTASTKQADYMRITSTVTSALVGTRIKPVELRSLVAPRVGSFGPNQGTLAVSVKDEAGLPLVGMPVSIAGPTALSDVTNEDGCAVFGHIAVGSYAATINQPGYVDPSGTQAVTASRGVSASTVQTIALSYARAANVNVSFDTKVGILPTQSTTSTAIVAGNVNVPGGGLRAFSVAAPGAGTIAASGLFPFPDGYTIYSGSCADAVPTLYDDDYFDTNPGLVQVQPGQSYNVTVREPALNLQVVRGASLATALPYPTAHLVITSSCGVKTAVTGLTLTGRLADPGFPFGSYSICADDNQPLSSNTRKVTVTGKVLSSPAGLADLGDGTAALKLFIDTSTAASSKCT